MFRLYSAELVLLDVKTPAGLGKTWGCQVSAYDYLLRQKEIEVDSLMSLRLRMDGGAALGQRYEGNRLNDFNVFLSALNAHRNLI